MLNFYDQNKISFLKDNVKQKINSEKKERYNITPPKSRIKFIFILGIIISSIMALGIIYIIPLINGSYSLVNPYQNKEISQNKIISGLIDLLFIFNETLPDNFAPTTRKGHVWRS